MKYKNQIMEYLDKNIDHIAHNSMNGNLFTHSIYTNSHRINLYILRADHSDNKIPNIKKLLICIEYHNHSTLEHYEIETLKWVTQLLANISTIPS